MILIVITYIAGVLTILSPCILPVLPFVFSKSQGSFLRNGAPLLLGMALTFSVFSGIAIVGGEWIGRANEVGRIIAMVMMTLFGVSLIFPALSEAVFTPLTRFGSKVGSHTPQNSPKGAFLIGISTGLLWAPCAGPILGLVLTGAATRGNLANSIILLFSYSLGAATSLGLALVAGNKFFGTLKKFLGVDKVVKKVLGVLVLLGVVIIAFNLDRTVLAQISKLETATFETKLLTLVGVNKSSTASEGELPDLGGVDSWINSAPFTKEALKGKVVLIDFWTYSCINCLRTLPYLKAWSEKYKNQGLVIIGVHTPEFAFEKDEGNVKKAVLDLGITYPVAVDSHYNVWNAFKNLYWPAHYFIDRQGHIRYHHFGEGSYDESEKVIQSLLSEDGSAIKKSDTVIKAVGVEASSERTQVRSFETYVGYSRAENFVADKEIEQGDVADYLSPKTLKLNQWSLNGRWLVEDERAISKKKNDKVLFRFHARDLHLVLGTLEKNVEFRVKIDGKVPGQNHGMDIDENGSGRITTHKLYQLIRQSDDDSKRDHTFEIEFLNPGAEVYAFTFG